ncbi:TolC family protein [Vibrio tapetis subsp. quintayensis]|uniref:TolC family protein n=1 Tax=Vibrio tapetis TaxID=52443 RepID=UPI0025B37473|nr:TolC family protein [Vibrio tapetis]MDN3682563.1 TolC family protein [Vibrio tapetis subsp. quintayensis]
MMKRTTSWLIGSVLALPFAAANAQPLAFEQAWQIVQNDNDSLAASQANVDRYRYLQQSKDGLNLPSIKLSANYTVLDKDVTVNGHQLADATTGLSGSGIPAIDQAIGNLIGGIETTVTERDIFSSSIRAIWPIFTGGRITAAQEIASGQADQARSEYAMERQARFEDLSKYYFSVVLTKEVLVTRQAVEKGLTQHRDFALKLEKQGQIAKVERLQAEASLDKARVDTRKAARDMEIASAALASMLNQKDIELESALFINHKLPPLSAFVDQTLATYPGLDILDAKKKQATNLVKAEDGKYLPEVFVYGDYSVYEHESLASQMKPDWMVGIGVSVPLIDTSGRSDRSQAAHSAVRQVQYLRIQAEKNLEVLVEKTYLSAEQSMEEVNGLESSLSLAKENLNLRSRAFNQGLSNSLEVVDAELYLASIKTQQHLARFNYLIALNKLLALSNEMNTFSQYESSAIAQKDNS